MLAKLPFSIRDIDIDVEEPVNVDDFCIDHDKIRRLQQQQTRNEDDVYTTPTTVLMSTSPPTTYVADYM